MKKSTLIIVSCAMLVCIVVGIVIANKTNDGPNGTYVCDDEFFGYSIRFDGENVYAGSSSTGKATISGENVTVTYTDGTTDRFIYNKERDMLTDLSGTLKWKKQ